MQKFLRSFWARTVLSFLVLPLLLTVSSRFAAAAVATITDVQVQGTLRVEEDAVRLRIKARKGEPFDLKVVDQDVKSIYRLGFFDDVKADFNGADGILTYIVKEKPYIAEITIGGNSKVSSENIEAALGVRPHTILDRDKVAEGVEKVKKLYTDEGYANAKVDSTIKEIQNNQAVIFLEIKEGKRLLIKKIRFEGNHVFTSSELRKVMVTKEEWFLSWLTGRGVLNRDVLTNDVALLSSFYYDHGYIRHKVAEPIILRRKNGLEVVIRIVEGAQFRVGKVEIGGELINAPEVYLKEIKLTTGQIFRGSRLREDIATLTQQYSEDGFAFASVDPLTNIQDKKKTVDVALVIKRGPPVHFNRITISGNSKTRDKVIRRELDVSEQELVSLSKIKASQDALKRTGYFKNVELTTQKTEQKNAMDLMVEVEEGPTGSLNLGGGFSSGQGVIFNGSISEKNLFGRGQGVSLSAAIGSKQQDFVFSYTEPYLFDTHVSFGFNAFNTEIRYSDFDSRPTGFNLRTGYPLKHLDIPFFGKVDAPTGGRGGARSESLFHRMKLGTQYEFKRDNVFDVSDSASQDIKDQEGISYTSSVTPSLSYDSRDDFFTPTRGTRWKYSLDFAGLGGDNRFIKGDTTTQWYYTFFDSPRWGGAYTLGLKNTVGLSSVFSRPNQATGLPISERYFPGGAGSVRGYEARSLGPLDSNGDVIGGDMQLLMSAEVVFPLLSEFGLKGDIFFDQGQAYKSTGSFSFNEIRRSIGTGIRWMSPFGPLAVDLGFALNAQPEDKTSLLSFSVGGQSF